MPDIIQIQNTPVARGEFMLPAIDPDELRASVLHQDGEDSFAKLQVDRFEAANQGVFQAEARIAGGKDRINDLAREIATLQRQRDRSWRVRGVVTADREVRIAGFHRVLWGSLAALGGLGLVMGLQIGANYIVKSGHDAYADDWWGALLFLGVTVLVGARLKIYERQLADDASRATFNRVVAAVAFGAFAVWIVAMAATFGLDTSTGASALLVASSGTGTGLTSAVLVGSHIFIDVACGYGIFAGAERLALGGHRIDVRENPVRADIVARHAELTAQKAFEAEAVGNAEDFLRRFDAARAGVEFAAHLAYRREAAAQRHAREAAVAAANVTMFSSIRPRASRAVAWWMLSGLALAGVAEAKTAIVVLPPDYAGIRETLVTQLAEIALHLAPDDQLLVYAAHPPTRVATIKHPNDRKSGNPAWLRRHLGEQFAPVTRYLAALPPAPADGQVFENIAMPDVLDEIGRNVIPSLADRKADVLLIGSPFYHDPRDARFSMTQGYYPSDGHLKAPQTETPFGAAGLQTRLQNANVHLCWINSQTRFVNRGHEELVRRFWSLWVAEQGGQIATISYDPTSCFMRLRAGETSGQIAYTIAPDAKVEMLRVRQPVPAALPPTMDQPGAWFLRDDVAISTTPPASGTGIAWIGLKWSANADVDLYVRPDSASPWLFFGNVRTPAGYFNKDQRSATGDSQYEFVELNRAIDLSKTEAMINLYSGELKTPPEGMVRIYFEGKVYEAPFKLTATRGNRGAPPMSGPHWFRIDLRRIVGLTP